MTPEAAQENQKNVRFWTLSSWRNYLSSIMLRNITRFCEIIHDTPFARPGQQTRLGPSEGSEVPAKPAKRRGVGGVGSGLYAFRETSSGG